MVLLFIEWNCLILIIVERNTFQFLLVKFKKISCQLFKKKTKIYKEKSLMFVKGRFVVGCTDVMIGGAKEDDGCFLRIFYPTKLTDPYVGTHTKRQ